MSPSGRVHSFHLAEVSAWRSLASLLRPPTAARVPGLEHAEVMLGMDLGAPIVSPRRAQLRRVAVFARWQNEAALERFLEQDPLGRVLAAGWHARLEFVRRWGEVTEFADATPAGPALGPDEPVMAVTLARMRLLQLPRFLRWGRPVEVQVRDHPGVTLAGAAMRPPHTISTYSVWGSVREMTGMVFGRDAGPRAQRHHAAMGERERRDFHHEFTTLRFRILAEHGSR